MQWLGFVLMGVVIGGFGTLIGAGGGFILMPVLLLMSPKEEPEFLACISLAVVFFNAASGTIGYARQKMIDYRAGLVFAAATVPGAVIGAMVTSAIPRRGFDALLGSVLALFAAYLLIKGKRLGDKGSNGNGHTPGEAPLSRGKMMLGAAVSFVVGFLSSLLGIGGGIVHVPLLVMLLGFPVHIAAATSHFVLAISAGSGTAVHIFNNAFAQGGTRRTILLGIGVIIGAQIGAHWSRRTPPGLILRGLGVALLVAGGRILWMAM